MPRYFFDLRNARGFHRDEIGDELVSFEEARDLCQVLLPDIVRDDLPNGDHHEVVCEVRDETGRTIYRGALTFAGTCL